MVFVPLLDVLTTLGFAAAMFSAWRIEGSVLRRSSRTILMSFLFVRFFIGAADILESAGITSFFDLWEDYAAILFLPLFVMFMYSVMMSEEVDRRLASETELRDVNEELEQQYHHLLGLDRMKDAFIRNVSHELKTPVAKHAMQIEILEKIAGRNKGDGEMEKIVGVMKSGIERQSLMIRNLLELSRLDSSRERQVREPLRVDELLRRILEDYEHAISQRGITVEMHLPPVTITSDSDMLWHVFSNLTSNAIKFRREDDGSMIRFDIEPREGEVVVRVVDNGIGMTAAEREQAFDNFFQSSASIEGSGVGLTISRMIMEKLGGSIRLESTPEGVGTAAVVTLPANG